MIFKNLFRVISSLSPFWVIYHYRIMQSYLFDVFILFLYCVTNNEKMLLFIWHTIWHTRNLSDILFYYTIFLWKYFLNVNVLKNNILMYLVSLVFTSKNLILVEFRSIWNSYKFHHVGTYVGKRVFVARDEWVPKIHPRDAGNLLNARERDVRTSRTNKHEGFRDE